MEIIGYLDKSQSFGMLGEPSWFEGVEGKKNGEEKMETVNVDNSSRKFYSNRD